MDQRTWIDLGPVTLTALGLAAALIIGLGVLMALRF